MPKRYKPFDVMKDTGARERLTRPHAILYGEIGPPSHHLDTDDEVSWLDLVEAAPVGRLERHHRIYVEMVASVLSRVRRREANKTMQRFLGTCLREMGLTPGIEPTPEAVLAAFKGRGTVN